MDTKFIGLKDFRQNTSAYIAQAKKKKARYIVLKKNVPMIELKPVDEKTFAMEKLVAELESAEQHIRDGKFYTQEQIMKEFGIN